MKRLTEMLYESGSYKPKNRMDNEQAGEVWDEVTEMVGGPEKMLDIVFQMLDTDTCIWIMENINSDYDLEIEELL